MDQDNLDRNTDALLGILDRIQFDGELENYAKTPNAKEAIKDFEYSNITVPFGYENQDAFVMPKSHGEDLVRGARTPPMFASGLGFKEEEVSEIFEPLTTTKQNGVGLGLVSCKSIIENHGGMISAQNFPTRFTMTLPKK